MSRSPLTAHLQRLLSLARVAERRGLPTSEITQRRDESQARAVTRRSVLQAGATGLALAASGALAGGAGGPEVAIVGAGVAGLVVAYRLHRAGVPYRVYEASSRAGGRMSTLRGHFDRPVELGGEFIDSGHTAIRRLARELGLTLVDLAATDRGLIRQWYDLGGRRFSEAQAIEAFRPLARQVTADLDRIGPDGVSVDGATAAGRRLDHTSLRQYLEQHLPRGPLLDLLDVAYNIEFGLETGEQSSLNFLTLVGTDAGTFDVFGESDERYGVLGGNDRIPSELARVVGERIQYGHTLEAIRQRRGGDYLLSLSADGTRRDVVAARVVLALPFSTLRRVDLTGLALPAVKRRAIRDLGYGTNAKLIAGFNRRVWREDYRSSGEVFTDQVWQNTWESSRAVPGAGGCLTNFLGGRHGLDTGQGTAQAQTDAWLGGMERVFPGLQAARSVAAPVRAFWPGSPYVRASYASYRVGQWSEISGAEAPAVGGLHFCGEHTSSEAQGYMEGGVESGERVARELLRRR